MDEQKRKNYTYDFGNLAMRVRFPGVSNIRKVFIVEVSPKGGENRAWAVGTGIWPGFDEDNDDDEIIFLRKSDLAAL